LRLRWVPGRASVFLVPMAVLAAVFVLQPRAFCARILQSQQPANSQSAAPPQPVSPSTQYPSPSAQEPEPPIKNPDVQPAPRPEVAPPTLTIPRLQHAPSLDDFLTMQPQGEAALQMAKVTGFTQRNPHDGEPVTEPTGSTVPPKTA